MINKFNDLSTIDFWTTFDTVENDILLTKLLHVIHMVLEESHGCGLKSY